MLPAAGSIRCRLLAVLRKEPELEEQQIQGPARHTAVCKIEDRGEKTERVPSYQRHPVREYRIYDREVEHVHHPSEHERGIIPYNPVEQAVNDIPHGSCGDQCKSDRDPERRVRLLQKPVYPPHKKTEQQYPEQGEQEFACRTAELHAEGHALVLYEINLEPVTEDMDTVPDGHIGLYEYLDDLVYHDQQHPESYK